MRRRKEAICRLRHDGYSNPEIAERLALPVKTVGNVAYKLIQEGRIDRNPRGRPLSDKVRRKRDGQVIEMVQRRSTLEEIGKALGVSREWVRKLIRQVVKKHGEAVFETDNPLYTLTEAAGVLRVNHRILTQLCAAGDIPCQRRGKSAYLIHKVTLKALRRHPAITKKRRCVIYCPASLRGAPSTK